jgi:hypothetical protein
MSVPLTGHLQQDHRKPNVGLSELSPELCTPQTCRHFEGFARWTVRFGTLSVNSLIGILKDGHQYVPQSGSEIVQVKRIRPFVVVRVVALMENAILGVGYDFLIAVFGWFRCPAVAGTGRHLKGAYQSSSGPSARGWFFFNPQVNPLVPARPAAAIRFPVAGGPRLGRGGGIDWVCCTNR